MNFCFEVENENVGKAFGFGEKLLGDTSNFFFTLSL